jgi:hypothetical protein
MRTRQKAYLSKEEDGEVKVIKESRHLGEIKDIV